MTKKTGSKSGSMREDDRERVSKSGASAWQRLKKVKDWHDWLKVGEALLVGREWAMNQASANQPVGAAYNMAFGEWLQRYKLHDMDKGDRSRLFTVMQDLPAIEEWRRTLTLTERLKLNHPNAVLRKWQANTRVPDPNKKPKPGLRESVADLSEENTQLKGQLADRDEQITALQATQSTPVMSLAEITEQWVTCFLAAADPDEIEQAAQQIVNALSKFAKVPEAISKAAVAAKRARGRRPAQQVAEYQIVSEPPDEPVIIERTPDDQ
jgi:hypothetical protein